MDKCDYPHARPSQRRHLGPNFLVEAVADALVEQQCEHVATEFRVVGVAAQDAGGLVEVAFKLASGGNAPRFPQSAEVETKRPWPAAASG
ncbi:hypothetical protein PEP31012_00107 [Pandoraea eparura]|uniref:Uncharacterized protein n=1 Tax=Pandoraea eparura TaxID=2508291 RepID=A0A5E4RD26_9BURK|nr:hypothetical protein PEP31012_00107 [Pandoraea eparura]